MKTKAAEEVGILYQHITLPIEATMDEIVDVVKKLNGDDTVSGIIVQLPLGDHISPEEERTVTEAVSPEKDVDGYAQPCPIAARTHVMCGNQIPCVQHRPPIFSCRLTFVHTVHADRRPAPARVDGRLAVWSKCRRTRSK
jgi:hypothetical protein